MTHQLTETQRREVERLACVIENMPATFDMGQWLSLDEELYRGELAHPIMPRTITEDYVREENARDTKRRERALELCGTCCCIGGTGELLFFPGDPDASEGDVGDVLGLTDDQQQELFYPWQESEVFGIGFISCRNRRAAAYVLRHYAATGEVDWKKADEFFRANPHEKFHE